MNDVRGAIGVLCGVLWQLAIPLVPACFMVWDALLNNDYLAAFINFAAWIFYWSTLTFPNSTLVSGLSRHVHYFGRLPIQVLGVFLSVFGLYLVFFEDCHTGFALTTAYPIILSLSSHCETASSKAMGGYDSRHRQADTGEPSDENVAKPTIWTNCRWILSSLSSLLLASILCFVVSQFIVSVAVTSITTGPIFIEDARLFGPDTWFDTNTITEVAVAINVTEASAEANATDSKTHISVPVNTIPDFITVFGSPTQAVPTPAPVAKSTWAPAASSTPMPTPEPTPIRIPEPEPEPESLPEPEPEPEQCIKHDEVFLVLQHMVHNYISQAKAFKASFFDLAKAAQCVIVGIATAAAWALLPALAQFAAAATIAAVACHMSSLLFPILRDQGLTHDQALIVCTSLALDLTMIIISTPWILSRRDQKSRINATVDTSDASSQTLPADQPVSSADHHQLNLPPAAQQQPEVDEHVRMYIDGLIKQQNTNHLQDAQLHAMITNSVLAAMQPMQAALWLAISQQMWCQFVLTTHAIAYLIEQQQQQQQQQQQPHNNPRTDAPSEGSSDGQRASSPDGGSDIKVRPLADLDYLDLEDNGRGRIMGQWMCRIFARTLSGDYPEPKKTHRGLTKSQKKAKQRAMEAELEAAQGKKDDGPEQGTEQQPSPEEPEQSQPDNEPEQEASPEQQAPQEEQGEPEQQPEQQPSPQEQAQPEHDAQPEQQPSSDEDALPEQRSSPEPEQQASSDEQAEPQQHGQPEQDGAHSPPSAGDDANDNSSVPEPGPTEPEPIESETSEPETNELTPASENEGQDSSSDDQGVDNNDAPAPATPVKKGLASSRFAPGNYQPPSVSDCDDSDDSDVNIDNGNEAPSNRAPAGSHDGDNNDTPLPTPPPNQTGLAGSRFAPDNYEQPSTSGGSNSPSNATPGESHDGDNNDTPLHNPPPKKTGLAGSRFAPESHDDTPASLPPVMDNLSGARFAEKQPPTPSSDDGGQNGDDNNNNNTPAPAPTPAKKGLGGSRWSDEQPPTTGGSNNGSNASGHTNSGANKAGGKPAVGMGGSRWANEPPPTSGSSTGPQPNGGSQPRNNPPPAAPTGPIRQPGGKPGVGMGGSRWASEQPPTSGGASGGSQNRSNPTSAPSGPIRQPGLGESRHSAGSTPGSGSSNGRTSTPDGRDNNEAASEHERSPPPISGPDSQSSAAPTRSRRGRRESNPYPGCSQDQSCDERIRQTSKYWHECLPAPEIVGKLDGRINQYYRTEDDRIDDRNKVRESNGDPYREEYFVMPLKFPDDPYAAYLNPQPEPPTTPEDYESTASFIENKKKRKNNNNNIGRNNRNRGGRGRGRGGKGNKASVQ